MFRFFSSCNKYSSFLRDIVSIWDMAMGFYDIRSPENTYSIRSIILSYKNRNYCWRVVIGELLFIKTLITPAVVSKWCTLLKIIFWNNFAGLNMCCALLNAAHFKGPGVWLSFNIDFYKDGKPPGPSKWAPLCVSYMMHTGTRVIRVDKTQCGLALGVSA